MQMLPGYLDETEVLLEKILMESPKTWQAVHANTLLAVIYSNRGTGNLYQEKPNIDTALSNYTLARRYSQEAIASVELIDDEALKDLIEIGKFASANEFKGLPYFIHAFSGQRLGYWQEAVCEYDKIIREFPETDSARNARIMLQELGIE